MNYEHRKHDATINLISIQGISKGNLSRIWFDNSQIRQYTFKSSIILFYTGDIRTKYPNHFLNYKIQNYISETELDSKFAINEVGFFLNFLTKIFFEFVIKFQTTTTDDLNWIKFDASNLVKKWQKNPENNFGLLIQVTVLGK